MVESSNNNVNNFAYQRIHESSEIFPLDGEAWALANRTAKAKIDAFRKQYSELSLQQVEEN